MTQACIVAFHTWLYDPDMFTLCNVQVADTAMNSHIAVLRLAGRLTPAALLSSPCMLCSH